MNSPRPALAALCVLSFAVSCSDPAPVGDPWAPSEPDARWLQDLPPNAPKGDKLFAEAPESAFRVLLVGEPFVLGMAPGAKDRVGDHLIGAIAKAEGFDRPVDVRHVALVGRSLVDECGFLMPLIPRLDADLIVHHTDPGDLDGLPPDFTAAGADYPVPSMAVELDTGDGTARSLGYLADGLDWESRTRLSAAREAVLALAEAVEAAGGRYQLLVNWGERNSVFQAGVARALGEERTIFIASHEPTTDPLPVGRVRLPWSKQDRLRMGVLLYGAMSRRDLAGPGALGHLAVADRELVNLHQAALPSARSQAIFLGRRLVEAPPASALDLTQAASRLQVHGGLAADGRVGSYASLILAVPTESALEGATLTLAGQRLAAGGDEARLRVWADGNLVGVIKQPTPGPFELEVAVPPTNRRFLSVRFASLGAPGAHVLERVELR